MSDPIDPPPDATVITLLTFTWGDSSVARYCSDNQSIAIGDEVFSAEPSIDVTMDQQQGGSQDVPVELLMKIRTPLDTLTTEAAHAPVRVKIEEVDPNDVTTRRCLWGGRIRISTRNPDSHTGLVKVKVSGWRFPLEVSVNKFIADGTCNNSFGDALCMMNLDSIRQNANITAINGAVVTVAGLTSPAGRLGYWRRGDLTIDGCTIMVRTHDDDSNLTLLTAPPADWLGRTAVATPGCDGLLETCKFFDREDSFTGFGIAIPSYNPLLETPA